MNINILTCTSLAASIIFCIFSLSWAAASFAWMRFSSLLLNSIFFDTLGSTPRRGTEGPDVSIGEDPFGAEGALASAMPKRGCGILGTGI